MQNDNSEYIPDGQVKCFNCGAVHSVDDPRCPYCGALNPVGAEKAYMNELDDLKDETDQLAEDAEDDVEGSLIEYECPHCGKTIKIDADDVDFDEDALCPECGKELFPELPDGAEEEPDAGAEDNE